MFELPPESDKAVTEVCSAEAERRVRKALPPPLPIHSRAVFRIRVGFSWRNAQRKSYLHFRAMLSTAIKSEFARADFFR